jgi:hypothetical protein
MLKKLLHNKNNNKSINNMNISNKITLLITFLYLPILLIISGIASSNEAPTITSNAIATINQDASYSYVPSATDADGDDLNWDVKSGTSLPLWLTQDSVTTLAGNGSSAFADGISADASFNNPWGVAADNSGNVYVADTDNHRIRKITPTGVVTTLAGSGTAGFADGAGVEASFNEPTGVAVDNSGNVYVADTVNNKIRKITSAGVVTTLAGSGSYAFADGAGADASFKSPSGVAVDSSGNVIVADRANHRIRKITSAGVVTTLAGSGSQGSTDNDGTYVTPSFSYPNGVAVDSHGNVYVADTNNHKIRKISPEGVVMTLAGSGSRGSVNGTGTEALFDYPRSVAVDGIGNVYVADSASQKIRKITSVAVVTTLAGTGENGSANGIKANASFSYPSGLAFDSSGYVYVADASNHKIRKIIASIGRLSGTPTNADVGEHTVDLVVTDGTTSVAHSLTITVSNINDAPTDITLSANALAVNSAIGTLVGTLNAADIDVGDSATFSFCGGASDDNFIFDGVALISNVIVDNTSTQSVCITATDSGDLTVDKLLIVNISHTPEITSSAITAINQDTSYSYAPSAIDSDGDVLGWSVKSGESLPTWLSLGYGSSEAMVTTLAGSGSNAFADGTKADASFDFPRGVAVDNSGNVIVADTHNHRIRKITATGVVTTLAGNGTAGFADGTGADASFNQPMGVAVDSRGNVYVADAYNHKIRKITSAGVVTTLAGNWQDFADGTGADASFNNPRDVAVDNRGNVYVADNGNHRIRKITPLGLVTTLGAGSRHFVDDTGAHDYFEYPNGVAVDSRGNVYVADTNRHKIRKITPAGDFISLAGSGAASSDDASGADASFNSPFGIAVDNHDNVYVSDTYNHKIRKISPEGVVMTLAGNGDSGSVDGAGADASFSFPGGIAVDSRGHLYVADIDNSNIRLLTPAAPELSGTPTNAEVGDYNIDLVVSDGTTTAEQSFTITVSNINDAPTDIILLGNTLADSSAVGTLVGTLISADIDVADSATFSFCGGSDDENFSLDGAALQSSVIFYYQSTKTQSVCITVTDSGNLTFDKTLAVHISAPIINRDITINEGGYSNYPLGFYNPPYAEVLSWSVKNGENLPAWLTLDAVTTFAGSDSDAFADGAGAGASFSYPMAVAIDNWNGNVYVADTNNHRIRKITPMGIVTTLAGSGTADFADGAGAEASFNQPQGVAVDNSGNVYVADTLNHRIRKITPMGVVTTLAGSGTAAFADGAGAEASFNQPMGVAVDNSGNVIVADTHNHRIRRITPEGDVINLAGGIYQGSDNCYGECASFSYPRDVAVGNDDYIYVADTDNHRIRTVSYWGDVSSLAGEERGFANGAVSDALFDFPTGVAVDFNGNVYVADQYNHKIRKISNAGVVTTLAGSGTRDFADGTGEDSSFNFPTGVAVDWSGSVYAADMYNHKIRKITQVTNPELSGRPTNADVGVHNVDLVASELDGTTTLVHSFTFTVIDVNEAPTDITLSANTLAENSAIGSLVGTLYAADIDAGDSATFSFCGGTDDDNFSLDGAALQSNVIFDYENTRQHSVCVRVIDSGDLTVNKTFTVFIDNIYEAPVISSTDITVINQDASYNYVISAVNEEYVSLDWSTTSGNALPSWLSLKTPSAEFELLGLAGFSAGDISEPSLVLDSADTPYVAYRDGGNENKVTVMTYDGSDWVVVGDAGFSAGGAYYISLAFDSSDRPYVAYRDSANDYKATVMTYDGSDWVVVGSAGFSAGQASYVSLALDSAGVPYVSYKDGANSNKATVMKYDGSDWVTVGDAGFSTGDADYTSLALGSAGTPYVAYRDGDNSNKATVMTYDGSDWVVVGVAGFSAGYTSNTSLALDSSDTPYVAYVDGVNGLKATVMKYDGSDWVTVGAAGFGARYTYNTTLALDSWDRPYVAYTDGGAGGNGDKATVMKYNGSDWVPVGTPGFSAGKASFTSLAVDSSGSVYVAYQDDVNGNHATVMKFNNTPALSGTPVNADVGVHNVSLSVSDGITITEHSFTITVNNINEAPTDITLSANTVTENSAIGTLVGTLSATDIDANVDVGETATFSFCGGANDDNFSLDGATLQSSVIFDYENTSTQSVCITVTDSENLTVNKTFSVIIGNVVNEAPVITSTALTTINQDASYSYALSATDEEGGALNWRVTTDSTLPSWLSLGVTPADFELVGLAGFSAGDVNGTSLVLDSSGTPYVAFNDSANDYKATVMTYDGSDWVVVGNTGFSAGQASYVSLALDSAGAPYVSYKDGANSNKATVMKYDGSDWVTVGAAGFSTGDADYTSLALGSAGTPYVAYRDGGNGLKATVMKYDGSDWVVVGTAGFSAGFAYHTSLALDSSDTPYLAYRDVGNSSKATVMTYESGSWVVVGVAGFSTGDADYTSLALDSKGTPYIAYRDGGNTNKATVMTYDGSVWVAVGIPGFSAGPASFHSLALDSADRPYVVYRDGANDNKATVMKYNGSDWVTVGASGFSAGAVYYTSLALDSSANVYVTYRDVGNGNDATVMNINNTPALLGLPANADVGAHNVSLNVSDGTTTVEQSFTITVANINEAPSDITLSANTLAENNAIGTLVGTLSASDIDVGVNPLETATFSFCGGTNDANFNLDGAALQSSAIIDYENTDTQSVCVKVTDTAGLNFDKTLTVNISDVNEAPAITSSVIAAINQDNLYNYTLGATDAEGDALSWSIKSGESLPSWLALDSTAPEFELVGAAGFSVGNAGYTSLALDSADTPYVAYRDNDNDSKATVMKYDGSAWVLVGGAGFSAGNSYFISLALDNTDTPYVAYTDNANGNKTTVMKYDGSAWVVVGVAGFGTGGAYYTSFVLDSVGTPYVAYQDAANNNKATVMKYDGTAWVVVGAAGFSAGQAYYISLALDSAGMPYLSYKDSNNNYKATVMSYNGSAWVTVGAAGFSAGTAGFTSLKFNSAGTPYLAYQDAANSNKATVMKYNGTAWVVVGFAGFSAGDADDISLVLDSTDTPYVTYADGVKNDAATVMKYNGSAWVVVGVAGFSGGQAGYISPALASAGTLFVAYMDADNSSKATVMSFGEATTTLSGTPSNAEVGDHNIDLVVSDGTTITEHSFTITVANVNEAPVISLASTLTTDEDNEQTLSFTYTDIDGDTVSASVTTAALNGEASVIGDTVSYIPTADFNGADSFTLPLIDSAGYTSRQVLPVNVNSVNDAPEAQADSFEFVTNTTNSYNLAVLTNDIDVEGDTLRITGARSGVGGVTHDGSILTFTPSSGFVGEAQLSYTITDGNGDFSTARVAVVITGVIGETPEVTAPVDVEVNATGLYTSVDLGVATAVNSQGQPVPISLVGGQPRFRPGNHVAYWQATDTVSGLTSIASQGVVVHPLVSLSKSQTVIEGKTAVVKVLLNGEAPSYPVIVSINVSGTANSSDYQGLAREVVITSGTQASIEINILQDELADGHETLILSLDSNNNGMKVIHTLTITEQNVAPKITLSSAQNGETRQVFTAAGGLVSITATLNDINGDIVSTNWQYDASLAMNENSDTAITLDPSELSPGMYSITLTATDDGEGQLSDDQTLYLEILAELVILTDIDSDGDMIPDSEEGFGDSDHDGIPDFLDAIAECNVIPQQVAEQNIFLVEVEPGVCLRKGKTLAGGETGGVQLTDNDLAASIGSDNEARNIGGFFDFIASGLPEKGQQTQVVLPQRQPIPAGAVYRKYSDTIGWSVFVEDANNQLQTAPGELGYCPPPASTQWTPRLTAGHWCVQLTLNDGGPNDNDGIANGTIVDPGGVAVLITNNNLPEANTDIARVKRNGSVTIDVLANDTDGDNDILSLGVVNATFGSVTITADQHLAYQSKIDFVGVDSITYTLSDGNGGSASSTVSVTVYVNEAPLAVNDSANTDDRTAIVLDVVSNDSDADGDLLSLISASVDFGVVVINDDNTLTYKPSESFSGTATVSYTIDDGQGEQATAEVTVLVEAYETVTVKSEAKGGSMGVMLLGLAGLVALRLRRYRQQANGALANAINLILCP